MPPVEERLSVLEARVADHDRRFTEVGEILRQVDRKIDALRIEMVTQFRWTIGIMLTLTAGILTAVLTR
jgi:hypothetical protein